MIQHLTINGVALLNRFVFETSTPTKPRASLFRLVLLAIGVESELKLYSYKRKIFFAISIFVISASLAWAQAPQYNIFTVAGNGTDGYSGDGGGATQASLGNPCKVAADNAGNVYIADQTNSRIREVTSGLINTIIGTGTAGYSGDGKAASQANISNPCGLVVDSSGNVYLSQSDAANSAVRKAAPNGNITTIAGMSTGPGFSGDGAAATSAQVNGPAGLARDSSGNLYIADTFNNRIRVVGTNGTISTIAGNGLATYAGDGGPATSAALNGPEAVAVDNSGNLYIADTLNHAIRMVSGGIITTIAGNGFSGFSGDNGPAVNAQLNYPKDVVVDAAGNVYIADSYNFRIRVITTNGIISTIAGGSGSGYGGDGGPGTSASLTFPSGLALGPNGFLYVADTQNNVIRLLTPASSNVHITIPPTITKVLSISGCGNYNSSAAPGAWIEIHGTGLAADTRTWASSDFQGNQAPTNLDGTQISIGGQSAVVMYISSTQVNAQVPVNIGAGLQQIVLTDGNGTSAPFSITINSVQPGLCQGLQVGVNTYVAAVIANTATYVLPSAANVPGITSPPAHPGEIVSFFGNGFGAVTPGPTQGQLVQQLNQLANPIQVFFGQTPATLDYAGLAPGFIGLYQFNVVVPNIPDNDSVPVTFAQGNFAGAPTLYTAVKH